VVVLDKVDLLTRSWVDVNAHLLTGFKVRAAAPRFHFFHLILHS